MSHILILGGTGYTGRLLARYLLEQTGVSVTIATRHINKSQAFAADLNQQFPGERACALYADATDLGSLQAAFRGHEMVIVAAPTTAHTENVACAAIGAGADYLDMQLSARKIAILQSLAPEIERAGRCFITEAGFHPGLPSALVRYAAAQLDTIETASVLGYLNMGQNLPYSEAVDELVEVFKDYQSQVYAAGHWTKPSAYQVRRFDFGNDIGSKQCYSMFFEELRPLPAIYPTLTGLGFYISESHWMVDWVITPIAFAWLKIAPRAVRPIGKFLWAGMGRFNRPPYRVELQVQAAGRKNGQPARVQASISHPDGYKLTAIPIVAALLQYLDGSARKPGLWMMGHLIDPARLMRDMSRLGARVEIR